jgi:hypothetical protein
MKGQDNNHFNLSLLYTNPICIEISDLSLKGYKVALHYKPEGCRFDDLILSATLRLGVDPVSNRNKSKKNLLRVKVVGV